MPLGRKIYFYNQLVKSVCKPVAGRCSVKKVLLEISQNSQENTGKKETLAPVFSCEFCESSKNTFSYKTPPVATSESVRKPVDV